jgi:hypothetical protein
MIVLGFVVALAGTFYIQYNHGFNYLDQWATRESPSSTFVVASAHVTELSAQGRLVETTGYSGTDWLRAVHPDGALMVWAAVGFGLVVGAYVARMKLSWWPIHPVMFIFWCGYTCKVFAGSFLLGWLVKAALVKLGGARAYQVGKPLMVGIIAGELVAALAWMLVGAIYWIVVGQSPTAYSVTVG